MKAISIFSFVFWCLLTWTYADIHMHGEVSANVLQVTAAQYCDFLNQNAASDPDYFYDQHMASDPATACIARVGAPGRWQYQVITGRENLPIRYINFFDEENFENFFQNEETNEDQTPIYSLQSSISYKSLELLLKSNQSSFTVDSAEHAQTLSLVVSPPQEKNHSFFSEAMLTKIGLIFLGVTMMEEGVRRVYLGEAANVLHSDRLSNFTRRRGDRMLETGDKTMDHHHLSPTQKSYGAVGLSSRGEETKADQSAAAKGKLDGVEMAVVSSVDRLVSHQELAARENTSMEKFSNTSMEKFSFSPSDNEETEAVKALEEIQAELKKVQQSRDIGKEALLGEAERSAKDVLVYAKICQRGDDLASLSHLAILDKFKEALTLRHKAVEHADNLEVRNYYSEAANNNELAACFAKSVQEEKNPLIAKQLNAAVSLAEASADARKGAAEATLSKNRTLEHHWVAAAFAFEDAFSFRRYASYAIRDEIQGLADRYVAAAEEAETAARARQAIAMGQAESQIPDSFFSNLREELSRKYALPENLENDMGLPPQQESVLPAARREGDVSSSSGVVASLRKLASSMMAFGKGNRGYGIPDDDTAAVVDPLHVPNNAADATETTSLLKKEK